MINKIARRQHSRDFLSEMAISSPLSFLLAAWCRDRVKTFACAAQGVPRNCAWHRPKNQSSASRI